MLIGLHGKARCGKDTIASHLAENFGFKQYAFADPMKEFLQNIFQWDKRHTYGDLKEVVDPKWGFTPRKALQLLGTEFGRALNPDLWLKFADNNIGYFGKLGQDVVVSDVRFENEANFVRERGVLWHIERPDPDKINGVNGHKSESGIAFKNGDIRIVNNQTVEDLLRKTETSMIILGVK